MVQSGHSAIPSCLKNERSSKQSVQSFFGKILIGGSVTWWNCNLRLSSVFLLHNSKLLQIKLRVHSLPSHCLEICKLDRWEILMNTKEWVSDDKIQITILILRRGPCRPQRTLKVHNYGQKKKGDLPFLADRCQKIVLGKLLIHKRGEDCLPLRCKKIRTSLISF